MGKRIFIAACIVYGILLACGFASEFVIPSVRQRHGVTTFFATPAITSTLVNLSLLFLAIAALIVWIAVSQVPEGTAEGGLLARRVFAGLVAVSLFAASAFGSVYLATKRIIVDDAGLRYRTLFEEKTVRWSDIERVNGNFVPASRLGLGGRSTYAWVSFETRRGETVRFSLRFMGGIYELERIISRHAPSPEQ